MGASRGASLGAGQRAGASHPQSALNRAWCQVVFRLCWLRFYLGRAKLEGPGCFLEPC